MPPPSTEPEKPSRKSSRVGWVAVSNGIEFSLVPRTELAEAKAAGFYRPEDRAKTVVTKDGRLYEVEADLLDSAISSGFTDLVAREKKRSRSKASVDGQPASPTNASDESISKRSAPELSESKQPVGPPLDDLLPGEAATTQGAPNTDNIPDQLLSVAQAVEQVEREAEQTRIERDEKINSLAGWRQTASRISYWVRDRQDTFIKRIGTNAISVALHLVILMLLSCVFLVNEKKGDGVLIVASPTSEELFIEDIQMETEPVEVTEPEESAPAETNPVEELEIDEIDEAPEFLASVKSDSIKPPTPNAEPAINPGDGKGKGVAKPTFFSSDLAARNFVFVIDNSNSMTKGRFETALLQLMLTVDQMTPKQRFYVIFYSDAAYGMMYPTRVKNLIPASTKNKLNLEKWLNTVPLCLHTRGKEAIKLAFELDPDVIYILGDGAFTDKADQYFIKNPNPSIVVHTRGMEVNPKLAKNFAQLAKKHRGTYKDVGVMDQGLRLSKQYPRPRLKFRGPVWGRTLPVR